MSSIFYTQIANLNSVPHIPLLVSPLSTTLKKYYFQLIAEQIVFNMWYFRSPNVQYCKPAISPVWGQLRNEKEHGKRTCPFQTTA